MIQTIEQATQTRVLIGQNGTIVVTGRTAEGIELAVKAIRMVEEEAHTSNLTQRIKILLNVPDTTPPQQTSMPSEASSTKSQLSETSNQVSSSTSQTEIQSELKGTQESHTEGQEREQYNSLLPQQNPNVVSAMPISNPSSSSSSSGSSLQSSPLEGASESEKSRKVDKERSITSGSGTESRKTKSAVKGVNEGTAEHGKKEEGA
jgi:exosome complex component RRP4